MFSGLQCNKRSVTIDLKQPGKALFLRLVERADCGQNFAPG